MVHTILTDCFVEVMKLKVSKIVRYTGVSKQLED